MQVTTKAIVLSSLKYGDTSLIVKAYTRSSGLRSYLLKGILSTRKGKLKPALFQPLSQLEIVAQHRDKGTLERIREAKLNYHYTSVYKDIAKNTMVLFLAEMLNNSIQEEEGNASLFHYLETALQWFDGHGGIANFHIYFLLGLTRFLGFFPDTTNSHFDYFDFQEGEFVETPSMNPTMDEKTLEYFKDFLGIHFDAIHTIKMNQQHRKELLNAIVLYFELHLQGFRKPRSLVVLNEVFS
ncbi:MAG: DNA repair protein RecO [Flavobacteriaceae bacterium]